MMVGEQKRLVIIWEDFIVFSDGSLHMKLIIL